jgi:hypothetical protein
MHNKATLAIAIGFLLATACLVNGPVEACMCGLISTEEAFAGHDAVFAGEVTKIEADVGSFGRWLRRVLWRVTGSREDLGIYDMTVTLKVTGIWKGNLPETVTVRTPDASVCCICGFPFEVGKSYLVYAAGNDLETSGCSGTKLYSEAEGEIATLNELAGKKE